MAFQNLKLTYHISDRNSSFLWIHTAGAVAILTNLAETDSPGIDMAEGYFFILKTMRGIACSFHGIDPP